MSITITTPRLGRGAGTVAKIRHGLSVAVEVVAAILIGPMRLVENRKIMRSMAEKSDHELRDIGLRRLDLSDTVDLPITSDIGAFLASRARERL